MFGHVGKEINRLQKHLEWLEVQPTDPGIIQKIRETRTELNCWLEKENSMWKHRSRLDWFREGDRYTRFFHAKASSRFQKNNVEGIYDAQDVWQIDESAIGKVFVDFYLELFSSSSPTDFTEILEAVQPKVTLKMNSWLIKEFHSGEVF